jgi:hypothetical protein
MNFDIFDRRQNLSVLTWLGKRDWTTFKDYPDRRAIAIRPRSFLFAPNQQQSQQHATANPIVVSRGEMDKYQPQHWDILRQMLRTLEFDVIGTFWYLALSKSLAGGPKLFQPTPEQCVALENTSASFTFEMYKQPYPVIIIEIPEGYRDHLKEKYGVTDTPSHVIVHQEEKHGFISVSAFLNQQNINVQLTVKRPEYETIEDSITKNRNRRLDHIVAEEGRIAVQPEAEADFDAAENVQRLALNFTMMMTVLGTKPPVAVNPEEIKRWKQEAMATRRGGVPTHRATEAQQNLAAAMFLIQFDQKIKFYDEIDEPVVVGSSVEIEQLKKSPRTHWRRGHWAQQPHGPRQSLRKPVFRKPVLVRAAYFLGDVKNTSVTYTAQKREDDGQ